MTDVLDPVWIPLAEGGSLAARVWLPTDAQWPCPAILEAIPYRRTDGTLEIDHPRFQYWAERGFAGVRLDIRGSGDSDGVLCDEYLAQEQDDNVAAIEWIAAQPWCSGAVGMIGYSWGGFAGLQTAVRRPPALRAVVTVNSTVRRYTDDCHYIGGSVNAHDMLSWATTMLVFDARPPDPEIVGDRWREMWDQRLEVAPPMIERWLAHQLEDDYWRHGSVAFDFAAIGCPVLAVGGWSDPYRNAVLELLEGVESPVFGLIGPWAHGYPHATAPGPMIAFLSECERFFGNYLRDDRNGYESEPQLRVYMQDFDRPSPKHEARSGRWISLAQWPPADAQSETLALGDRSLRPRRLNPVDRRLDTEVARSPREPPAASAPGELRVASVQANGLSAGNWCPYGGPSQPLDQRSDDAFSLCFDSAELREPLEILGFPRLRLRVAADRARAVVIARLCDVSPEGESLLVTRGVLNLAHRAGHDRVSELVPGQPVTADLRLDCAGHRFARGHRVRVAISPTYWPWVWPAPEEATLSIDAQGSELGLPLLGAHSPADLGEPEQLAGIDTEWISQSPYSQIVRRDVSSSETELLSQPDFLAGRRRLVKLGLEAGDWGENVYRIVDGDPLSAEVRCRRRAELGRAGWEIRVEADATMRSTATEYLVDTELRTYEDDRPVLTRRFETRVARRD